MHVVAESDDLDLIYTLAEDLISEFGKQRTCNNKPKSGGEGCLDRTNMTDMFPPYYVFVVAGRAAQHH